MRIAVLGAGHVGLVTGGCLATLGHEVHVFDVDERRIQELQRSVVAFEEPHLRDLLAVAHLHGRVHFSSDAPCVIRDASLVFVCVDTPSLSEGDTDLTAVLAAARMIGEHARPSTVVITRSTAPVGTLDRIQGFLDPLPVVVNPEFLSEGSAVADFLVPDRIVVGARDPAAARRLLDAYDPIVRRDLPSVPAPVRQRARSATSPVPVVVTTPETAELAKYAANAHLCVRVSFMNEIASIADAVGADVSVVAQAIGLDHRIGPDFLRPGIGWGGSCFPKDIAALQQIARGHGVSARILRAADKVNERQRAWVTDQLCAFYPSLRGRRIGVLGLAFKPHTDDVRNAPALEVVSRLLSMNARVVAFDPAVLEVDGVGPIELATTPIDVARGADALVVATDWPEFAELDLERLRSIMRTPILLDGRNLLDPARAQRAGFIYVGVGRRPSAAPQQVPSTVGVGRQRGAAGSPRSQGPPSNSWSLVDRAGPGRRRARDEANARSAGRSR